MNIEAPSEMQIAAEAEAAKRQAKEHEAKVRFKGGRSNIFGSFTIDDNEFAISASAIKEVVNEPTDISPVPLSPPYMTGLFNLRGMIIPVIDLRQLLEFPEASNVTGRKVAVIEHGQQCIGLLFDKTGEVLSDNSASRVRFLAKKERVKDTVIDGVLKFDDGERLVQILDPFELLQLEKVPCAENVSYDAEAKSARGERRNCLSFQTGHTSCAIDLRFVKEITEMPNVDQSFLSHGYIIGTANLRGTILPVIDFRGFMGDGAVFKVGQTIPKDRKMLVVETTEGPVGLMVFSVDSILTYYENEVLPFSKLAIPRSDFVGGCLIDENKSIVMMLDQTALSKEPSFVEAAKSCQEIYADAEQTSSSMIEKATGERRTLIQFTIGRKFALDTRFVSEVLNKPSELLEPPYSLSFVEGIINLRGELITLINPRSLYEMPAEEISNQKVLIFKQQGNKYGILVDSVDEIVMTNEDYISDINQSDSSSLGIRVSEDISKCVQHREADGRITSILLLDAEALVARCVENSRDA